MIFRKSETEPILYEPSIVTSEVELYPGVDFDDLPTSTLILNEIPNKYLHENNYDESAIADADLITLIFNPCEEISITETIEIYEKIVKPSRLPCVFIASQRNHGKSISKKDITERLPLSKQVFGPLDFNPSDEFCLNSFYTYLARLCTDRKLPDLEKSKSYSISTTAVVLTAAVSAGLAIYLAKK